jgi:hypothetical protein
MLRQQALANVQEALTTGGKSLKAPSHKRSGSLGFRKLDDLPSERLTKWIGEGKGGAARRKRHLKCNAHQTDGLGVEPCTV